MPKPVDFSFLQANSLQELHDARTREAFFIHECRHIGMDPAELVQLVYANEHGEGPVEFEVAESRLIREVNYRVAPMTNSAPILPEAWRRLLDRGTTIMRDRLAVFSRLAAASTTPVDIADLVTYFPQVSDSGAVTVTLDGQQPGNDDQAVVKYVGTPSPIISARARFGWRQMEQMRKSGTMLQTETIANKQRKVAEKLEDMVLNGDGTNVGGMTIFGLRNHPSRNTGTHGFDLNNAATTGANWMTAFTQAINLVQADNAFGPVTFFINYADWTFASLTDFKANGNDSILSRLLSQDLIADIVPCSRVPADNILGVAGLETGEWGTILSGMAPTVRPLTRHNSTDPYVFDVMASMTPQLRTDFENRAPFVHLTAA